MQKVRTDTTGEFQRETTFQLNAPAETARAGSNAGKSVAVFPWTTDFGNNVATVAVSNDSVIITSAYNQAAMCRLKITLGGAVKVWKNKKLPGKRSCPRPTHGRTSFWQVGVFSVAIETVASVALQSLQMPAASSKVAQRMLS